MKLTTMSGQVPADSILPLFTDIHPALVDPLNFSIVDGFTQARATLANGLPDVGPEGVVWSSGAGFAVTAGSDEGYVTGATNQTINLGVSDGKVTAVIRWGTTSYVGVLLRYVDANNYIRATISAAAGIFAEKRVAGVNTTLLTQAQAMVTGRLYAIGATFIGDQITIAVEDLRDPADGARPDPVICDPLTVSDLQSATIVGIAGGHSGHRILEFVAG